MSKKLSILILLFWLIMSVIGAFAALKLEWDTTHEIWFLESDETLQTYKKFNQEFGHKEYLVVGIKNKNLFSKKDHFEKIKKFTEFAESLPEVLFVESLSNHKISHINHQDEITIKNLFDTEILTQPVTDETKIIHTIQKKHPETSLYFNKKSGLTFIFITLDETQKPIQTASAVMHHLKTEAKKYPSEFEFLYSGSPALTEAFYHYSKSDTFTNFFIFYGVLIICCWALFRWKWGVILPLVIVSASTLTLVFFSQTLGFKINNMTAIIPVLLLGIGVSNSFHYMTFFLNLINHKSHLTTDEIILKIKTCSKEVFKPCLLTSITTIIGFLSLLISKLLPLRELGILTALGVAISLLATFTIIPAFFVHLKKFPQPKVFKISTQFQKLYLRVITSKIIMGVLVILVCLAALALFIKTPSSKYTDFFKANLKIAQDTQTLEQAVGGVIHLDFLVTPSLNQTKLTSNYLQEIQAIQNILTRQPEVKETFSLLKPLLQLDYLFHQQEIRPLKSIEDNLIQQYLFLFDQISPNQKLENWYSTNTNQIRISAQVKIMSADEYLHFIKRLEGKFNRRFLNLEIQPTGIGSLFAVMESYLLESLASSLFLSLLIMSLVMIITFRKIKIIFLSLIVNIIPLLFTLALLKIINKPLDIGIAMTFCICLGIIVDDTIHFLHHFTNSTESSHTSKILQTLKNSGVAIVMTSIVLCLSFLAASSSSFMPIQNFGRFAAFTIFTALIFDTIILPLLTLKLFQQK